MVVVSYSGKEINAKLVYYGPGLSGKTTNLEYIYQSVPQNNRGKMVSMKTRTERTLFFDFLPVDLGEMGGFKTRFLLYTVPGQVYYNATRKLVLRGVDAVIFVADSACGKMDENIESLQNLHDNLKEYGLSTDEIPLVMQYNKRDLDDVYSIEELEETLNPGGLPYFEAVATTGQGVFETFRGIARVLLQKLSKDIKLGESRGPAAKAGAAAAAGQPGAQGTSPKPAAEPGGAPEASKPATPVSFRAPRPEAPTPPRPEPAPEPKADRPRSGFRPYMPGSRPAAPAEPEPAAPEPTLSAPEPTSSTPEPTSSTPEPKPVQAADYGDRRPAPKPLSAEPKPRVEEPKPERPEPKPMEAAGFGSGQAKPVEPAGRAPDHAEPEPKHSEPKPVEASAAASKAEPPAPPSKPEPAEAREDSRPTPSGLHRIDGGRRRGDVLEVPAESFSPEPGEERKPGFLGRLFGRKGREEEGGETLVAEAQLAPVELPQVGGSGDTSPVFIERRIQVPVTLGPDEMIRGAKLRVVLEIKVEPAEKRGSKVA
jgi:signal recognition particle receptor subunit beta